MDFEAIQLTMLCQGLGSFKAEVRAALPVRPEKARNSSPRNMARESEATNVDDSFLLVAAFLYTPFPSPGPTIDTPAAPKLYMLPTPSLELLQYVKSI